MIDSADKQRMSKAMLRDHDFENFEKILVEYKKVIQELKRKAILKYGPGIESIFGM